MKSLKKVIFIVLTCPFGLFSNQINLDDIFLNNPGLNTTYIDKDNCKKITEYANNPFGWSALNYAIQVKDFKLAFILATYCEDVNRRDPFAEKQPEPINALERLIFGGLRGTDPELSKEQLEIIHMLLERGATVKDCPEAFSPLQYVCKFGFTDLIICFANQRVNVNESCGTPLQYLIKRGDLDMARFLISKGANIKRSGTDLLSLAVNTKKCEILDFLLQEGLDISKGSYVLMAIDLIEKEIKTLDACLNHRFPALEMFAFVLEKGANPNTWISEHGLNQKNYKSTMAACPLLRALALPAETSAQHIYRNYVIQLLLDKGASIP